MYNLIIQIIMNLEENTKRLENFKNRLLEMGDSL